MSRLYRDFQWTILHRVHTLLFLPMNGARSGLCSRYHPPPSSPLFLVSLFRTTLVQLHVMLDVANPPHSWPSFCPGTSYFHLHSRLHLVSQIHPQNVSIPAQPGLPHFLCDVFNPNFFPNFITNYLPISQKNVIANIFVPNA